MFVCFLLVFSKIVLRLDYINNLTAETLNQRFETCKQAPSDIDFFNAIFDYVDIVENNVDLKKIIK